MVTKPSSKQALHLVSSVLAKIHMVTKLLATVTVEGNGSVLAKIHMVTKHTVPVGES